jgi:hypothetical protein
MNTKATSSAAPVDGIVITSSAELLDVRWKTVICNAGEKCWCRCVVPEHPVVYDNGMEAFIVGSGELCKELAEHVTALHNAWLETR